MGRGTQWLIHGLLFCSTVVVLGVNSSLQTPHLASSIVFPLFLFFKLPSPGHLTYLKIQHTSFRKPTDPTKYIPALIFPSRIWNQYHHSYGLTNRTLVITDPSPSSALSSSGSLFVRSPVMFHIRKLFGFVWSTWVKYSRPGGQFGIRAGPGIHVIGTGWFGIWYLPGWYWIGWIPPGSWYEGKA